MTNHTPTPAPHDPRPDLLSARPRKVGRARQDDADDDAEQAQGGPEDLNHKNLHKQCRVGRVGQGRGRADDADAQAAVMEGEEDG